jgi:CheY-like chemotaxis protein/anti-sigma regulatory factor (Ser/Thr protein kinase)
MQATAAARSIAVQLNLDRNLRVDGDAQRLQQIVWNLLSNSIKFTPRQGRIDVSVEGGYDAARIVVRDTGIGISRDLLPFVFDPFRQSEGGSAGLPGRRGLGLGLAIVRQLVELHGGTVTASSDGENRGTTVIVTLPVAGTRLPAPSRDDASPSDRTALPLPQSLAGIRALVVEDDEDSRELACACLSQSGAIVTAVARADETIALLATASFDVLVSDIGLPDETGYDLLRRVRAIQAHSRMPAIALTAYARADDRERAFAAGFQAHLAKPIQATELVESVAHLAASSIRAQREA